MIAATSSWPVGIRTGGGTAGSQTWRRVRKGSIAMSQAWHLHGVPGCCPYTSRAHCRYELALIEFVNVTCFRRLRVTLFQEKRSAYCTSHFVSLCFRAEMHTSRRADALGALSGKKQPGQSPRPVCGIPDRPTRKSRRALDDGSVPSTQQAWCIPGRSPGLIISLTSCLSGGRDTCKCVFTRRRGVTLFLF